MDLEQYIIPGLPDKTYYIPNFITPEKEKYLLDQISRTSQVKWTQLSNRRLQNWGGVPHQKVSVEAIFS